MYFNFTPTETVSVRFIYFIGLVCFNLNAFSQVTPFDFLEASRKANETVHVLQKLNSRYGVGVSDSCETLKSTNGEAVATCSIKDSDYQVPILKMDYELATLPVQIQEALPAQFIKDTQGKKISCIYRFGLTNDNQQMLGRGAEKNSAKANRYGDDFGRTHGMNIGISCASADGLSNAFTYSTELYSDPDRYSAQKLPNGNVSMRQKFTSENIFMLLQDDINKGKVTYWKRGVGFINLSEKKKWGLLQSTGQQEWFHDVVNKISAGSAYQYTDVDGKKDQWGAFITLAIGLQENRKFGDHCTLKLNADVGARISSLKDTSTVNLNSQAKMSYQVSENASIYVRAQSETIVRSSSVITENTLATGVETPAGMQVELGVMAQNGNRTDVSDSRNFYTGQNDLQVFMKIGRHF